MNKAIFLDRDGTINIDKSYLYKIEDFEYLPGVIEALKELNRAGYLLIIVTNQSGIARGYFTEEQYEVLNEWLISDLAEKGIIIAGSYYCPHLPDGKIKKYRKQCKCRKPEIGLFERAKVEFDIDLKKSYVIGDKMRDLAIADKCSKGYLLYSKENMVRNVKCISGGLKEAADLIIENRGNK